MDVVLPVGRVEHLGGVVRVLLLRHAHVDSDVRIAQRVVLKRDVQLLVLVNFLYEHKSKHIVVSIKLLPSKNCRKIQSEYLPH